MSNKRNRSKKFSERRGNAKSQQEETKDIVQNKVYEALKYDASNIYFNNLVGTDVGRDKSQSNVMPGILKIPTMLNIKSKSDMVNVAATSIYTYVRHANSGKSNYESSDLMVYLLAVSEVLTHLTQLTRAYGLMSNFNPYNLYHERLIETMGFQPEERANLANIRYRLNSLIHKLKAFAIPATFNFYVERMDQFANVYMDEDDPHAQLFYFQTDFIGEWNPTGTGGSGLYFREIVGSFEDRMNTIEDSLDKLRRSEDVNIMSGDILKAYGSELIVLEPIAEDFAIAPIYDPLVSNVVQNGHYIPAVVLPHIRQKDNKLNQDWKQSDTNWTHPSSVAKRYINSNVSDPDADYIFAVSKYQINIEITDLGTTSEFDLVSGYHTILLQPKLYSLSNGRLEIDTVEQEVRNFDLRTTIALTKFRNHPYIYQNSRSLPLGDVYRLAVIDKVDTDRMNDARFILSFQTAQMA